MDMLDSLQSRSECPPSGTAVAIDTELEIEAVSFEAVGLGDRSYLVHDGKVAVVIDPQREQERYLAAAKALGVSITHVLETHVHNDYVSGGLGLARQLGGLMCCPRGRTSPLPTSAWCSATVPRSWLAPLGFRPWLRRAIRPITCLTCSVAVQGPGAMCARAVGRRARWAVWTSWATSAPMSWRRPNGTASVAC